MKIGVYTFNTGEEPKDLKKENAKLKKQLAIAVEALDSLRGICFPQRAEKALKQIKELDK